MEATTGWIHEERQTRQDKEGRARGCAWAPSARSWLAMSDEGGRSSRGYSWPVAEGVDHGYKTRNTTGYVGELSVPYRYLLVLLLLSPSCRLRGAMQTRSDAIGHVIVMHCTGTVSVTHMRCVGIFNGEALGAATEKDRLLLESLAYLPAWG